VCSKHITNKTFIFGARPASAAGRSFLKMNVFACCMKIEKTSFKQNLLLFEKN
jgi:hypothetical protein